MKGNTLCALLFLLLFSGNMAFGQKQTLDKVTMKNGQVLLGNIKHYEPGKTLELEQADGSVLELQDAEISQIQQGVETKKTEPSKLETMKIPVTKKQGLYTNSMLSFAAGGSDSGGEGLSLGAGFSQVVGYHFQPSLGLGFGIGVDNYARRGETVYPVFAELHSFLPSRKKTGNFYGLLDVGYAIGFPRDHLDITKAEGGLMGYAALGYRAATVEGLDINVDLGFKFQRAHFERSLYNGDLEVRDVDFRRLVIRVGLGLWK